VFLNISWALTASAGGVGGLLVGIGIAVYLIALVSE